jgi:hypothetical protein
MTYEPDLFCVTETWFKDCSDVNIDNYNIYRADCITHGSGVYIYVNQKIQSCTTNIEQLNSKSPEQIWINLKIANESVLLGCLYRPPTCDQETNEKIISSIEIASKAPRQNKNTSLMVVGDFNYSDLKWLNGAACQ